MNPKELNRILGKQEPKQCTTATSSNAVEGELQAIPEWARNWLFARDAELQRFRKGPANARATRTRSIEEAIEEYYVDHKLEIERYPIRLRTSHVLSKLRIHHKRYGLARTPDIETIRRVVYRLA